MSIGAVYTLRVHQDPATDLLVLNSMQVAPFTYDGSFNGNTGVGSVTVVKKEDYPSTKFDAWVVQTSYASASIPAGTTTLDTLLASATTAIQLVEPTAADGVTGN